VGDIHGRADLLHLVIAAILDDIDASDQAATIVFVGDYVDRGVRSRDVVEQLLALEREDDLEVKFLRGNHDQSVLEFLFNPTTGPVWCDFGGRETLVSYGVQPPRARTDMEAWAQAAQDFARVFPEDHRRFFENLELCYEAGDYFFAHAGARPGVALDQQEAQDLMWIRQPFLDDTRKFDKIVVHGHTPSELVHADSRRIGIDTGAYATDVLTAVRLRGEERALIQTQRLPDRSWRVAFRPMRAPGDGRR
jgi:serine/threonine protein phosphatase 1